MTKKNKPFVLHDLKHLDSDQKDYFLLEIEEAQQQENLKNVKKSNNFIRKINFLRLFFFAIFLLLLLSFYLWGENLIYRLFSQHTSLGWFGLAVGLFAIFCFIGFIFSELWLIYRLTNVDHIHKKAYQAYETKDLLKAQEVLTMVQHFTKNQTLTQEGRQKINAIQNDILNSDELLYLIETEIFLPLDQQAVTLVLNFSKRLSLFTALTPRLFFEIFYILFETIGLVRKIAELYGARPSNLGGVQILRRVFHHLGVTSGLSLTDNFLEQFIGHNVAARVSARLGEGFINGVMLSRVGIAAIESLRPFPFLYHKRPNIKTLINALLKAQPKQTYNQKPKTEQAPQKANLDL